LSLEDSVWYALVVRPRSEKAVAQALASRGVEAYLPVYRSSYRSGGRFKDVDLPLFPQYLFCRTGTWPHGHILSTPGVFRFVAFGRILAPVDPHELRNVQRLVESERELQPWPFMKEGDLVEIAEGPLRSLVGRLIATNGECKLILQISLLRRSVAVKIDREWVRPINIARNSVLAAEHESEHCVPSSVHPNVIQNPMSSGLTLI
jgi:transcription antitermination factor NusG